MTFFNPKASLTRYKLALSSLTNTETILQKATICLVPIAVLAGAAGDHLVLAQGVQGEGQNQKTSDITKTTHLPLWLDTWYLGAGLAH